MTKRQAKKVIAIHYGDWRLGLRIHHRRKTFLAAEHIDRKLFYRRVALRADVRLRAHGWVGEVLAFDRRLSPVESEAVRASIADWWGTDKHRMSP